MRTLVIIPAYNEQSAIVEVVNSVIAAGYDYVVVNDGSTDDTMKLCEENRFNALHLSRNLGIGGAVQTGHRYALEHGYDFDVQLDGDGQHDVREVPTLLEGAIGSDLVIGSRFAGDCGGYRSTAARRAGIRWLGLVLRVKTGLSVTDPTSGFRACSRRAIELFARDYPQDYPEPESIALAARSGLAVEEVPVAMRERAGGASSIGGLSPVYYMVKVTLAILIAGRGRRT